MPCEEKNREAWQRLGCTYHLLFLPFVSSSCACALLPMVCCLFDISTEPMEHDGDHSHEVDMDSETADSDVIEIPQSHVTTLHGHASEVCCMFVWCMQPTNSTAGFYLCMEPHSIFARLWVSYHHHYHYLAAAAAATTITYSITTSVTTIVRTTVV